MENGLFTMAEVKEKSYCKNYEDQILVIKPSWFNEHSRTAENQLFLASGGFGCDPSKMGTAVFGQFLIDEEKTRMERYDFLGILDEKYLPEWAKEKLKQIIK